MSSEPSDFDDYNVGQHSMHPVDIPENKGDEGNPIIDVPPTDQYEQLDEAQKQLSLGNHHVSIKIMIDVIRGLL